MINLTNSLAKKAWEFRRGFQLPVLRFHASASSTSSQHEELLKSWERVFEKYSEAKRLGHADISTGLALNHHQSELQGTPLLKPAVAAAEERLSELFRVFSHRVGAGAVVPELFSARLMHFYRAVLHPNDRGWFFRMLCNEMGLNVSSVSASAERWKAAVDRAHAGGLVPSEALYRAAERLGMATRPMYIQLLLPVAQLEEGIGFLVQLRGDLISVIKQDPAFAAPLRALSEHLRQALAGWFSPGLVQLRRITWESTSGDMLERIIKYEAVHPMEGWEDLRRRLDERDRRVFAFIHPCLPGEPLVILHTALTQRPATSIQCLMEQQEAKIPETPLQGGRQTLAANTATVSPSPPKVAVFCSISSTQPGLSGVELGHFMIQKVAEKLMADFPTVELLITLSPIPNFRDWLCSRLAYESSQPVTSKDAYKSCLLSQADEENLRAAVSNLKAESPGQLDGAPRLLEISLSASDNNPLWKQSSELLSLWLAEDLWLNCAERDKILFQRLLMRLAAKYLVEERRRNHALDPVANFHLRNGAQLWKMNWWADTSDRGIRQSFGIMVNYRYDLDLVYQRNQDYVLRHIIAASNEVNELLIYPISPAGPSVPQA